MSHGAIQDTYASSFTVSDEAAGRSLAEMRNIAKLRETGKITTYFALHKNTTAVVHTVSDAELNAFLGSHIDIGRAWRVRKPAKLVLSTSSSVQLPTEVTRCYQKTDGVDKRAANNPL